MPRDNRDTIRPGLASDEEMVRKISDEVFTVFGEYGSWLPGYLAHSGVWSHVYEIAGNIVGFTMLGMIEPECVGARRIADVLAIAVSPSHQNRGIGTKLLIEVLSTARELRFEIGLDEVRLTVAETNVSALKLFKKYGFLPIAGDHGYYNKGQRALRLGLEL